MASDFLPRFEQEVRSRLSQDPEIMAAVKSGGTATFQRGNSRVEVSNGQIRVGTGSWWKPVVAGALMAGGAALTGGALMGAGGAGAGVGAGAGAGTAGVGGAMTASTPWWQTALQIGGPLLGAVVSNRGQGGNQQMSPEEQALMDQQRQLFDYGLRRQQRMEPVHEAAMKLAMNLAPTGNSSPRMAAAIQSAQRPPQQAPMSPQVREAIERLMARGGR